jgi:DNA polymerase III sliding clamp (beta) subunit (PCNA family)
MTINKKDLENALKKAAYFVPKSSMIPILNNGPR